MWRRRLRVRRCSKARIQRWMPPSPGSKTISDSALKYRFSRRPTHRRQFLHDARQKALGVAKKHDRVWHVIKIVVDSREPRIHAALDHHDGSSLIGLDDRHARNRALGISLRPWIHH